MKTSKPYLNIFAKEKIMVFTRLNRKIDIWNYLLENIKYKMKNK